MRGIVTATATRHRRDDGLDLSETFGDGLAARPVHPTRFSEGQEVEVYYLPGDTLAVG